MDRLQYCVTHVEKDFLATLKNAEVDDATLNESPCQ